MARKQGRRPKGERPSIRLGDLERSFDLLFAVDEKARLTYVGRSLSRLLRRRMADLRGRKVTALFSGRVRRVLAEAISAALEKGGARDVVLEFGSKHYSFSIVTVGGDPSRLAFLGKRTISTREELRVRRLARVVECMEECVCLTDLRHKIIYVNPAMADVYGFSREEMEGEKAAGFFENIPGNPKDLASLARSEARGASWRKEIFGRRKDGSIFPIVLLLDTVRDENGRRIGYVGVSQDITEQKRLHAQLVQAEKMAAIGQLASGLAHEFNNLIAIISGRAQFSKSKGTDEEKDRLIEVALRMCERAKGVTANLLSFARRVDPKSEPCDVEAVLEKILSIVARDIEADHIKIVRRYGRVPRVIMDGGQMQQVFLNILINARHAMPDGGTLTIRIKREGEYVKIDFTDTGVGIEEERIGRIFEPFETTKGPIGGGGLPGYGLGLAVSYGIVKQHKGEISVKSAVGKGSTFTIKLPIAAHGRRRGRASSRKRAGEVAERVKRAPGRGARRL